MSSGYTHMYTENRERRDAGGTRTIFWPLSTSFQKPYRYARLASAEKEATPSSCVF